MQPKQLIILLAAAVVLCVAAIVAYNSQQTEPYSGAAKSEGKALYLGKDVFPDLESKMTSVARVEVEKKGDKIVVARGDSSADWKVETVGGYPADPGKINKLVVDMTEMKVGDRLTNNPANYANFALTSASAEAHVRLADSKGAALADLTWGRESKVQEEDSDAMGPRTGGRFFLRGGDPYVYLAKDDLSGVSAEVPAWVDTSVVSVAPDKIVGVHIDHNSTETLTLTYGDNKLQFTQLEPGMQAKDYEVSGLSNALDGLHLSNVMPAGDEKAKALKFGTLCDVQSKDGTIYHVQTAQDAAKKWYMTISATYGSILLTTADKATTVTEAAAVKAATDAEAAVPAFNAKHSPWVYELQPYTAERFVKKRSDLMQPEPKKEEAKPGETTGATGSATPTPAATPAGAEKKPAAALAATPAAKPAAEKKPAATPVATPATTPAAPATEKKPDAGSGTKPSDAAKPAADK